MEAEDGDVLLAVVVEGGIVALPRGEGANAVGAQQRRHRVLRASACGRQECGTARLLLHDQVQWHDGFKIISNNDCDYEVVAGACLEEAGGKLAANAAHLPALGAVQLAVPETRRCRRASTAVR